ncbi:MAG: AMP-binding protein [Bryobacterales bacterium]|nr:AMP-binding protein [Bryobacterales bacterium]
MHPPRPVDRKAVETAVLATVRDLLDELDSSDLSARVSLRSSLERDLGLGSLERVEILVRLETALGLRLPETAAQTSETPAHWVRAALSADPSSLRTARWPIRQPSREAAAPPLGARTFSEVLRSRAEQDPARVHIHLLDGDGGQDISHGQLLEDSSRVAAGLVASGLEPGETVAIMLPTCEDFFSSFLGVMLAGGIAVPVYPPFRPNQIEEYIRRQALILRNAGVRFLIAFEQVQAVASVLEGELPTLREILSRGELSARGGRGRVPGIEPAETFFIQYTSGSTGDPKGVTLTHANVIANIQGIGHAVEVRPTDTVVSWLPLYHDMGLIGSWLFSLYQGLPITVLSPLDFLLRPERWLWALSDSRGTLCPAPNFAFELCVRKIRDDAMDGVDLSKWRVAINAGEPVLAATLEKFAARFGPWGFDSRSFMPFYGLAESSVALTYPPFWRGPAVDRIDRTAFESTGRAVPSGDADAGVLEFVANGRPLPEHEVRVVGDNGDEMPDRARGRIVFRGPSATAGYFRNPEATAAVFDEEGWLDSGDLGYVVDGELYVTGRVKDCIIKGGHNIIPQDVEMAAWKAEGVRKGCVAAFGTTDPASGTEKLVVVVETRLTGPAGIERMRAAVTKEIAARVGIPPDDVVPVRPGFVPKTSSGKIQRIATRDLYVAGKARGSRTSATWVQMARVGARAAVRSSVRATAGLAARTCAGVASVLGGSMAIVLGMAARLAPGPAGARYAVTPGARIIAWLAGSRNPGRLAHGTPCVLLANRASRIDPLLLAAALRSPFVFADRTGFEGLSPAEAFLLEPLVASGNGRGTLPAAAESALRAGCSLVSLADCPVGEPPARTRFRAEPFLAAASSGAPLAPVALQASGRNGSIVVGAGDPDSIGAAESLPGLRRAVRKALEKAAGGPSGVQ